MITPNLYNCLVGDELLRWWIQPLKQMGLSFISLLSYLFSLFRVKCFADVSSYMLFQNQVRWTKFSRNIKFNYRREKYYKKTLMFSLLNIKFIKYDKVTQIKYNIKGFFTLKFLLCLKDINYVALFTFTLLIMKLLSWNRRKLFLCLW